MYQITCSLTREFANAVKLSQIPNPDFVCGGRKKAEDTWRKANSESPTYAIYKFKYEVTCGKAPVVH